jgi:hypothetical protein
MVGLFAGWTAETVSVVWFLGSIGLLAPTAMFMEV